MPPREVTDPLYEQIAASLRGQISSGHLGPGVRLPSQEVLRKQHGVTRVTVRKALEVLQREGLVVSSPRSGTFVRRQPVLDQRMRDHYRRPRPGEDTSPTARQARLRGKDATWRHSTVQALAADDIAERLAIEPGARVMRTDYLYFVDGQPLQGATSWEPYDLVGGTDIEFPEAPESRRPDVTGVIPRFDLIGIHIDRIWEDLSARMPTVRESLDLDIPERVPVLTLARTQLAGQRVVEVADIVIPADRYTLQYEITDLGEPIVRGQD